LVSARALVETVPTTRKIIEARMMLFMTVTPDEAGTERLII
jgi:hypothetical protein